MKNIVKVLFFGLIIGTVAFSEANAQDETNNSSVTITEYADYQCPACGYYHGFVQKLKQELGDKIEVEMRFFPLANHQYGALTARAAQAAKNQGKFQEMHNLLFENQEEWSRADNAQQLIKNYARQINLDMNQFEEDLNAGETQKTVMQQKEEGVNRGVNATPTFFIEGEKVSRLPRTYEGFKLLVESHLSEK